MNAKIVLLLLWISLVSISTAAIKLMKENNNNISIAKPSFLFLLVDDIGWGDFSYNNGIAHTVNIDKFASESMVFYDFHSGGTVCSPTRATVLTGRNHFRDCVDTVYGCRDMSNCVPDMNFAPSRTFTVGDAFRLSKTNNANNNKDDCNNHVDDDDDIFFAGKWHLGSFYNDSKVVSSPTTHGFDHYNATIGCAPTYATNCQCKKEWKSSCRYGHYNDSIHFCPHSMKGHCCSNYWWDDPMSPHGVKNMTEQESPSELDDALYLVDAFSRFITERKQRKSSFLAQISFHNCHIPFVGSEEAVNACVKNETCRPPTNGIPYTAEELDYYACLVQLDTAVGQIFNILKEHHYFNNTMIWFTSDNGPEHNCPPLGICNYYNDSDPARPIEGPGSAGVLRGRKRDIYEGGHRVPGIISWPSYFHRHNNGNKNNNSSNTTTRKKKKQLETWEIASTMDFLPTIMDVLNVTRPYEQQSWTMDGRSILPLLRGEKWKDTQKNGNEERGIGWGFVKDSNNMNMKKNHHWGYRYGKWKYVLGSTSCTSSKECQKAQLYDLENDLGERYDLSLERPDIYHDMERRLQEWHRSILQSRKNESRCYQHRLYNDNDIIGKKNHSDDDFPLSIV